MTQYQAKEGMDNMITEKRKPGRPKKTESAAAKQETTGTNTTGSPSRIGKRGKDKQQRKQRVDRNANTEQGENTKYLQHDLKLFNLPPIDLNNPEEVKDRVNYYLSVCAQDDMKPTVASLALAFSVSRFTLFDMLNGKNGKIKNSESIHTIKTVYDLINSYYEHLMNNGKINPVAGIFLMKNNMGYKDTTDYVLTANQENTLSLENITERAGLLEE